MIIMLGYLKVKELYNYFIEIYIIMNGWVININMRFIIKNKRRKCRNEEISFKNRRRKVIYQIISASRQTRPSSFIVRKSSLFPSSLQNTFMILPNAAS